MKARSKQTVLSVAALVILFTLLGGCSLLLPTETGGAGSLYLAFQIPDYTALSALSSDGAGRAVDPQVIAPNSHAADILLDGNWIGRYDLAEFEQTPGSDGLYDQISKTISVPAGTYDSIGVRILDINDRPITGGTAYAPEGSPFEVLEGGDAVVANIYCTPVEYDQLPIDQLVEGPLPAGEMAFGAIVAVPEATYTITIDAPTGTQIYLFDDLGARIEAADPPIAPFYYSISDNNGAQDHTFTIPIDYDGLIYPAIYSPDVEVYISLTVSKTGGAGFVAADSLVINEVYLENQRAIEIHYPDNGDAVEDPAVDLSGYRLQIDNQDSWEGFVDYTIFPGTAIPEGGYLVVHGHFPWDYDRTKMNYLVENGTLLVLEGREDEFYDEVTGSYVWERHWDVYRARPSNHEWWDDYGGYYTFRNHIYDYDRDHLFGFRDGEEIGSVELSPDGRYLLYATNEHSYYDLYVFDLEYNHVWALTDIADTAGAVDPIWSQDGSTIVWTHRPNDGSGTDIYKASFTAATGDAPPTFGTSTPVTTDLSDDAMPAWTTAAGSDQIAFVSNAGGDFDLYTINSDGTSRTLLYDSALDVSYPAWSPDATMIAFCEETLEYIAASHAVPTDPSTEVTTWYTDYKHPIWVNNEVIDVTRFVDGREQVFAFNIYDADPEGSSRLLVYHDYEPVRLAHVYPAVYDETKMNYVFATRWFDEYSGYRFVHFDNLWPARLSISLVDSVGTGYDFVRFGDGYQSPPTDVDWFGQFGTVWASNSMERITDETGVSRDEDTALDWVSDFATLGFPNHVDGTDDIYFHIR